MRVFWRACEGRAGPLPGLQKRMIWRTLRFAPSSGYSFSGSLTGYLPATCSVPRAACSCLRDWSSGAASPAGFGAFALLDGPGHTQFRDKGLGFPRTRASILRVQTPRIIVFRGLYFHLIYTDEYVRLRNLVLYTHSNPTSYELFLAGARRNLCMITFMHGIFKQPNFQALGACLLKVLACVSSIQHPADAGDLALPPIHSNSTPGITVDVYT